MPVQVTDSASNRNEQIENAARAIGRSTHKRAVFEAIHFHKKSIKTVDEIAEKTNLDRKAVLNAGGALARKGVIEQVKVDGRVAYRKNDFLHHHKREVLQLAGDNDKLKSYPTKRNIVSSQVITVSIPVSTGSVTQITIDDIDSFSKVSTISVDTYLPKSVKETHFKNGIQSILGEPGTFSDWGGERNDLFTTRMVLSGKRCATAFAFKGPGTSGTLKPGKMGKNGDQIQRLFQSDSCIFVVQYWRDIDESVVGLMKSLALAKSATSGEHIMFGIMDGYDSHRIYLAYRDHFDS